MYHQRIFHSTYINHKDIILGEQSFFPGKPYWCRTGNVTVSQTNIAAFSLFFLFVQFCWIANYNDNYISYINYINFFTMSAYGCYVVFRFNCSRTLKLVDSDWL